MWNLLTNSITVRRATAEVLAPASAGATMTWTRQPVRESVIEFSLSGAVCTGTLTVTGTSGGVAQTETVTTNGPRYYRTTRAWTALVGLTTSGLADEAAVPTVSAAAVGPSGTRQEAHYTLVTGWPCAINAGGNGGIAAGGRWPNHPGAGRVQGADAIAVVAWDPTWEPREGDLFDDDAGRTWLVVGKPQIAGTATIRHWAVRLREHETA